MFSSLKNSGMYAKQSIVVNIELPGPGTVHTVRNIPLVVVDGAHEVEEETCFQFLQLLVVLTATCSGVTKTCWW